MIPGLDAQRIKVQLTIFWVVWLADLLGLIGLYFLLAVELTSLARKRLSKRVWRMTHYLSFPLFGLATIHLLAVGTDRKTFLLRFSVIVGVVVVVVLTAIRAYRADRHDLMVSPKV